MNIFDLLNIFPLSVVKYIISSFSRSIDRFLIGNFARRKITILILLRKDFIVAIFRLLR